MYKQSTSRGHRSKGIKGKQLLQFCVLLAVSFWLIYQVKHSHDKRKELEAKDGNILGKIQRDGEPQRLGRKDLPSVIATDVENVEDKELEEEENKHSEDQPEREENNVSKEDGNSELNDKEPEHEEEQVHELKDREDNEEGSEDHSENEENEGASLANHDAKQENEGGSEENHAENEERESEENSTENEEHEEGSEENHTENEENEKENVEKEDPNEGGHDQNDNASQDQDHDGGNTSTHQAQEELYKADDASSEVAQNAQTIIPETDKVTTGHENGLWGNINFSHDNETTTTDEGNAGEIPGEDKVNNSGALTNATVTEEKKYEGNSTEPENSSLQNSTLPSLPKDQPQSSSGSTAADGQHRVILLSNETQRAATNSNGTENVNTNNEDSSSSTDTTSGSSHEMNGTDATLAGDDRSLRQGNKSENSTIAGSDEASEDQSSNEGTGSLENDPIDATDTELGALPEIRNDVQDMDDTVAE